ncbi:MAG: dihydroorotate dehydrogenase electron transfer subunit [Firmicutes bacterium]|nr:dihydroorotate dehydrogenase electron transfer subunit [Bacillota bacterium]
MSLLINATILSNNQLNNNHYLMKFNSGQLAAVAKPGQFLHVKCGGTTDPLLRRPISIHSVNKDDGVVGLLYRVAGKGTKLLSQKKPGEILDVMGPLGNGFTMPNTAEKVAVVGGGIGIAPLYYLLQKMTAENITCKAYLGARTAAELLVVENIKKLGIDIQLASDDGSTGFHGPVTELLKDAPNIDRLYTCGPLPMMKAVAQLAGERGIPTQVSLEERMGCGVGACLACTCRVKTAGDNQYKRVCADGPVFNAGEVVWDD